MSDKDQPTGRELEELAYDELENLSGGYRNPALDTHGSATSAATSRANKEPLGIIAILIGL